MRGARVIMAAAGVCGVFVAAGGAATAPANIPVSAGTVSSSWNQTDSNAALSRANLHEHILTRATVGKVRHLRGITAPAYPPDAACGSFESPGFVAPVLAGGRLYAVANGRVTKYNPATGKVIWQRTPVSDFSWAFSSVALANGLLIVGAEYCESVSSPAGQIQAFNASTGALVWSQPTGNGDRWPLDHLVVSGGYVVAAGSSAEDPAFVQVRRVTTGALVWQQFSDCVNGRDVMVVAQRVISNSCDQSDAPTLTARSLGTGALAWSRPGAWGLQRGDTDASTGRHVYATDPSGTVVSLDPLTGKTQYQLAGATGVLAVATARVFADCGAQGVCAYSITSGSQEWNTQPGSPTTLAASAGGVLYLDQGLALNTGTGKTMATLWAADSPAGALAVGNGRIAAATGPNGQVLDLYGL
jgi:outer membrane protein assembly factor BamB